MVEYDISVGRDLLPELLSGQNGLAKLVEAVLNQILIAVFLIFYVFWLSVLSFVFDYQR